MKIVRAIPHTCSSIASSLMLSILCCVLVSCSQTLPTGSSLPSSSTGYLAGLGDLKGSPSASGAPSEIVNHSANPAHSGYWDGEGAIRNPSIHIYLSQQKAYFYDGAKLVGVSPISSGSKTHRTPTGRFKVTQKNADHKSSLYGVIKDSATGVVVNDDADTRKHRAKAGQHWELAPMPYFMRFNGAIGMHVGHLPGYPASHGCVRLPQKMAEHFFQNSPLGTPVLVKP